MITSEQLRTGEELEIINFKDARTLARLSIAVANIKAVRLALKQGVDLTPQVGPEVRIGDSLKMSLGVDGVLATIFPLRTIDGIGYRVSVYNEGSAVTFKSGDSELAQARTYTPNGLMKLEDGSIRQMYIEAYAYFASQALDFLEEQQSR
jgi:hypothetical protein